MKKKRKRYAYPPRGGGFVDGGSEKVHKEVGTFGSAELSQKRDYFSFVLCLLSLCHQDKGAFFRIAPRTWQPKVRGRITQSSALMCFVEKSTL